MRILLYGMQSSGASVLAFTLAQRPDSLAFVDVWQTFVAPELKDTARDIVAKVVVTTAYSLELHRRRFRPDVTLLVLRDPVDNYHSLFGRSYANENGGIDEKFALLENVFRTGEGIDDIVHFEDFAFCPSDVIDIFGRLGWKVGYDALLFGRDYQEIQKANQLVYPGINERLKYGPGNIQSKGILRDRVRFSQSWGRTAHLPILCPSLFEHYRTIRTARGEAWHVPSRALLSCDLHLLLREMSGQGNIPRESRRLSYHLVFTGGTAQCRITDTEVLLFPTTRRRELSATSVRETRLAISGLPGQPFNSLRGVVFAEHPLALGTVAMIRIETADGANLVQKELVLRHAMMQNFDLRFEPQDETIALTLSVRLNSGVLSAANSGLSFRNLRLEQVAN